MRGTLLKRVFDIGVEHCLCGSQLMIIAGSNTWS
jgi:hypothetical protein